MFVTRLKFWLWYNKSEKEWSLLELQTIAGGMWNHRLLIRSGFKDIEFLEFLPIVSLLSLIHARSE